MGEALLRHHLEAQGVDARVHSAGTMRWRGRATDEAITAMRQHGLDVTQHRSRPLTPELIAHADLVLAMTRAHVDFVALRAPDARDRVFMVRELARLGVRTGPRGADEPVRDWLARVAALREPGRPIGHPQDEVSDPVGEPLETYLRTAAILDDAMARIAGNLAGTAGEACGA
jgi:protein-tyrosine-phosphatase